MLTSYLKLALRVLRRRPFFTFVSLFGTSFTLVVLMVVSALLDHLLAPYPPETHLARTLAVRHMTLRGDNYVWSGNPGYKFLAEYVRGLPQTEAVAIFRSDPVTSFLGGEKVVSRLVESDAAYWQALDFRFVEGGPFTARDDELGNPVAVINVATRDRFLGPGPASGKVIAAAGRSYRVVGVVANVPPFRPMAHGDIYAPLGAARSQEFRDNWMGDFHALILARARRDFPAIRAAFADRIATIEVPFRDEIMHMHGQPMTRFEELAGQLSTTPRSDEAEPPVGQAIAMIALAALLFMSLPAINLVNINLSRIYERAAEIGVRKAFGASSRQLIGQFVLENVLLSLLGGGIGLVGAAAVLHALNTSGLIPYAELALNVRIFAYAVAIAIVFGVLSGVYPAWRMSRLHPVLALRGGKP